MKVGTPAHKRYLIELIRKYAHETGIAVSHATRNGFRAWVSEHGHANASDMVFRHFGGWTRLLDRAIEQYENPKHTQKTRTEPPDVPVRTQIPRAKVYVVTYAQNATPVHGKFLKALQVYCEARSASLLVIPGRYKNPTSVWDHGHTHDEWWAPELAPYLFSGRFEIPHLCVFGDISIQPTASTPLSSFEVFAGNQSAIFGHPKVQLITVPTAKRRYPRIFATTGAVTQPNYTDSKAGKKGEAHHVFGALVVEEGPQLFHLRQINAMRDGSFIDLDTKYTATGTQPAGPAKALVCGDIHVDAVDPKVIEATFEAPDSIVRVLRPKTIIYHDVLDFGTRNHHTIDNFPFQFQQTRGDRSNNVEQEVERAIRFLDEKTPAGSQGLVVCSNHDEAFDKWLQKADIRLDPVNARFFHEAWYKLLQYYERHGSFPMRSAIRRGFTTMGAFKLFYEERGKGRVRFLDREEPEKIGGVYIHFHGDEGLGGSPGNSQTYAKLGVKTIIGHSHRPGIRDGCYQVGLTGSLDMEYNATPSAWMNTHCVIYSNNKRSLIHIVDGEWRGV